MKHVIICLFFTVILIQSADLGEKKPSKLRLNSVHCIPHNTLTSDGYDSIYYTQSDSKGGHFLYALSLQKQSISHIYHSPNKAPTVLNVNNSHIFKVQSERIYKVDKTTGQETFLGMGMQEQNCMHCIDNFLIANTQDNGTTIWQTNYDKEPIFKKIAKNKGIRNKFVALFGNRFEIPLQSIITCNDDQDLSTWDIRNLEEPIFSRTVPTKIDVFLPLQGFQLKHSYIVLGLSDGSIDQYSTRIEGNMLRLRHPTGSTIKALQKYKEHDLICLETQYNKKNPYKDKTVLSHLSLTGKQSSIDIVQCYTYSTSCKTDKNREGDSPAPQHLEVCYDTIVVGNGNCLSIYKKTSKE